jgi:hypothetical protein
MDEASHAASSPVIVAPADSAAAATMRESE